jgi:hypothetical protein
VRNCHTPPLSAKICQSECTYNARINAQASLHLSAGPQLLELLSALEVARSNLLRPAGYFADFAGNANQQQAAQQLLQHVSSVTAPVYADSRLLLQLLEASAQAVQQLTAAAVEAAALPGREVRHLAAGSSGSSSGGGAFEFVHVDAGLAVSMDAAASAATMSSDACELLQHAETTGVDGACSRQLNAQTLVTALQAGLSAVDAALNSAIPCSSRSSSSSAAAAAAGDEGASCTLLQQLMVCRQLLACSWLPPLAAAAAAAAAATESFPPTDGAPAAASSSSSSTTSTTTKQLLRSALATLSAVSNSSTHSAAAAPLLLLTEDQAAVLRPLLIEAGLDSSTGNRQQQQQQQQSNAAGGSSSSSTKSPWLDLSAVKLQHASSGTECSVSINTPAACDTANVCLQTAEQQAASVTAAAAADNSSVASNVVVNLQVHEGPGSQLLLRDMISMTDQAQQLLHYWLEEQQQQQQQADSSSSSSSSVALPAELPLQVLRASADVVQLLLRHHPNAGVRQQLYISGLLPLLQLQQQVQEGSSSGTVCNLSHVYMGVSQ